MISLSLGLLAALFWGLHDFSVRRIGGRADAAAMLMVTLTLGGMILAPLILVTKGPAPLLAALGDGGVVLRAVGAGLSYALASYGLYRAFTIGPVRLVAPICGAYPVLSVLFALLRGSTVEVVVWLGVIAVIAGIALVARGEGGVGEHGNPAEAALWAALAACGFAATFGLAQWAAEMADELSVSLLSRGFALAGVVGFIVLRRIPLRPVLGLWRPLFLMGALDVCALTAVTLAAPFPSPEFAAVASSIFGSVTIILAWRFLGEALRPVQWLGVGVVFVGIAVLGLA